MKIEGFFSYLPFLIINELKNNSDIHKMCPLTSKR